jgi:hypothetical protein
VEWRRDGREVFYVAPGNRLTAVSITLTADGSPVDVGTPQVLFDLPLVVASLSSYANYVPSPDGQSFLISNVRGGGALAPITVVLNWKPQAR